MQKIIIFLSLVFSFSIVHAEEKAVSNARAPKTESGEDPFIRKSSAKPEEKASLNKANEVEQAPSEYTLKVKEGITQVLSRNFTEAIEHFQKAIELDSEKLEAYDHLATTFFLVGKKKDAIETYRLLDRKAAQKEDWFYQAKALHGTANFLELMDRKSKETKDAWKRLVDFAAVHSEIYKQEWAQTRLSAIEGFEKMDKEYEEVRKRIAERKKSVEKDIQGKNKKKRKKK